MIVYKVSVISGAVFSFCCLIIAILVLVKLEVDSDDNSSIGTTTDLATTDFATTNSSFSGNGTFLNETTTETVIVQ